MLFLAESLSSPVVFNVGEIAPHGAISCVVGAILWFTRFGGRFRFPGVDFCRLEHASELHVAVKFGAVNFRCELSHIPPTYVLSLAKLPWNKTSWSSIKHCQSIVSQAKNMAVHYHAFYKLSLVPWVKQRSPTERCSVVKKLETWLIQDNLRRNWLLVNLGTASRKLQNVIIAFFSHFECFGSVDIAALCSSDLWPGL